MNLTETYPYLVDISALDSHGALTPLGYQKMIILTTEKELKRIGLSIPDMLEKFGVSWILLSLSVKIIKPFSGDPNLTVKTWHTWKKGITFRRDFEIRSQSGEVLAYGATFSSLIDLNKRRICMDRKIYDALNLEEGEPSFEAESKTTLSENIEFCEQLAVRPSWIDSLDHVNNFKYSELAFDVIPSEFLLKTKEIDKIEIFFTGELRLGETVKLYRSVNGSVVEIKGEHGETSRPAFAYRITFKE